VVERVQLTAGADEGRGVGRGLHGEVVDGAVEPQSEIPLTTIMARGVCGCGREDVLSMSPRERGGFVLSDCGARGRGVHKVRAASIRRNGMSW